MHKHIVNTKLEIGIHWYEEEEYTTTENGKTVTKTRRVRRTEWHSLSGTFAKEYSNYWSVVLLVFRQKKVWSYNPLMSVFAWILHLCTSVVGLQKTLH